MGPRRTARFPTARTWADISRNSNRYNPHDRAGPFCRLHHDPVGRRGGASTAEVRMNVEEVLRDPSTTVRTAMALSVNLAGRTWSRRKRNWQRVFTAMNRV